MTQAHGLRCNGFFAPLGVDSPRPAFAWRADGQEAYRLTVATAGGEPVWDSGRVEGAERSARYAGPALASATAYVWKVMLWQGGEPGPWSEPTRFETGLLRPEDWRGHWIQAPKALAEEAGEHGAPLLRTTFTLEGEAASARAYVSGLGYFELTVNGKKAGDDVLSPAFTAYDRAVLYRTYDITGLLRPGQNAVGVTLGNGMYNVAFPNAWDFEKAPWRDRPKLLFQAQITGKDGAQVTVVSDSRWRAAAGPIVFNSLYVGETYDARRELPGWDGPGYDDAGWRRAVVCRAPGGVLRSMQMEPCRVVAAHRPASLREVRPGVWVYDVGLNIAGWPRLAVSGPAGTAVRMDCAERLGEDGDLDAAAINNLVQSDRFQSDTYILKGEGTEVWEPRFTYHGFQYVRLTGFPGTPDLDAVTACEVHTDLETAGRFSCSNELLNKIQAAARQSTVNNFHGMPTDCPHREKNGWTGDALLSSEQTLLNYHPANAYRKWLADIIDSQRPSGQLPGIAPTGGWGFNWGSGPAWDSALVLIPWNIYLYTGDAGALEQTHGAARRYLAYMDGMSEDGTLDFGLGDWCPPHGEPEQAKCPTALTDTGFYYLDTLTVAKAAGVLGDAAAEAEYRRRAERIRGAFLRRFVNGRTGEVEGDCQTSYGAALYFALVDGELAEKAFARLVDEVERCNRHIDCGILGAKFVLQALTDGGRADLAYAIAAQRDFPSWGRWIEQGATTLWEMWDGRFSRNHHMFSDISSWFYKGLAGIRPDEAAPGFRRALLCPNPVEGLEWARAEHETPFGLLRCGWRKAGEELLLDVEVPAGASALLRLPRPYRGAAVDGGAPAPLAGGVELAPGCHSVMAR